MRIEIEIAIGLEKHLIDPVPLRIRLPDRTWSATASTDIQRNRYQGDDRARGEGSDGYPVSVSPGSPSHVFLRFM